MSTQISGTSGVIFPDASTQNTAATGFGFKNRIINGAMMIDQRNYGASVTVNNLAVFWSVDRFKGVGQATAGVYTLQQVSDAPAGFVNSLKATVTTADSSLSGTDRYIFYQPVEGLNASDLGFGTANASPVTISFWTKSSLTGTFGGCLQNDGPDRSCPFSFTINSANTWEYKTVTIAGDTTGTWPTNNTAWGRVNFSLGSASSYKSTANTWGAGNYLSPTGSVDVISTLNATFQVTGVQLEKGSTATSFDYRPYGTELALCQRYFQKSYKQSVVPGTAFSVSTAGCYCNFGTAMGGITTPISYSTVMRSAPTVTTYDVAGNSGKVSYYNSGWNNNGTPSIVTDDQIGSLGYSGACTATNFQFTASAEL